MARLMKVAMSSASPGVSIDTAPPRSRVWLLDLWAAFLIAFPVLGTFYAPETYFAGPVADIDFAIPITQPFLVICSVYIVAHLAILSRSQRLVHQPLAYAFVVMAFASMEWSYDPYTTFTRALRLLPLVGLGVLYGQAFPMERTLRVFVLAFLGSAICSIVMAVVFPSYGLDRLGEIYANAWRGAILNKNGTGFVYAIGLVICLFGWQMRLVNTRLALFTALLCAVLVVKAQSTTAVGAVLLALPPTAIFFALRREAPSIKLLCAGLIGGVAILLVSLVVELPEVFTSIGKDATFNGRLPIWEAAWTAVKQKPILGHAYAFWGMNYPERNQIWHDIGLPAPHAHNSWLDLTVQLGVVGWALIALLTVTATLRLIYCWAILAVPTAVMLLTILFVLIVRSQTEVQFSAPAADGIFWLVWISTTARVIRSSRHTSNMLS